jgi:hypothetical protein
VNDGGATGKRPRQALLVDIHHLRVARCPSTGGVLHVGVSQWMLATVDIKANRSELNSVWCLYVLTLI